MSPVCQQSEQSCEQACGGCGDLTDIEDFAAQVKSLQAENAALSEKLRELRHQKPGNGVAKKSSKRLRSEDWFCNEEEPALTTLYMDRYLNYGLTPEELTSKKPIIGIAQSGSDLVPCNRYHLETAKRVKEGIRAAGAIPVEFPIHPIQESARRPTATLDRNLAAMALVEILHGYPLDGVVLLTGCDKTTPACLMAAATVVSTFPMLLAAKVLISR